MKYQPGSGSVVPTMVSSAGPLSFVCSFMVGSPASAGTVTGRVWYYPIFVPAVCIIRRVWWINGSTVSASYNIAVGIYEDAGYIPGRLIVGSASTAQGTATNVQFVDVTDTTLGPGRYWIAVYSSNSSATLFRLSQTSDEDQLYQLYEATASLPATATPVTSGNVSLYLCGFATTASP